MMITLADGAEVQPDIPSVTVKLYVPVASPDMVVVVPVPVIPPGFIVQVPDAGKPFKTTLPVASVQLGWVIAPTIGAEGVGGCTLMTTVVEGSDVQPDIPSVTVKL